MGQSFCRHAPDKAVDLQISLFTSTFLYCNMRQNIARASAQEVQRSSCDTWATLNLPVADMSNTYTLSLSKTESVRLCTTEKQSWCKLLLRDVLYFSHNISRFPLIRYGVTANITAFHAVARGSIPRIGAYFLIKQFSERYWNEVSKHCTPNSLTKHPVHANMKRG